MTLPFPVGFMRSPTAGLILFDPVAVGISTDNTGSTNPICGPFTPEANSRLFALSMARRGSSLAIDVPVFADNLGGSWITRADAYNVVGATRVRLTLAELTIGASPAEMTVNVEWGTISGAGVYVMQVRGYAGAVTNVCKEEVNTAGDATLTFGATPNATSLTFAAIVTSGATAMATTPAGWANIYDRNITVSPMQFQTVWDRASAAGSAAWTSVNGPVAALGWEVPVS